MSQLSKRILSVTLSFLLVLSVLVVGIPTEAGAITGSKTYNTGTRNETATSLSSQAEAYYTGDYTWESLSALQGGTQDCVNTDDNELYQALHELMESTMTNRLTYKSLKTQGYIYSDTTASNTSSYSLIYSSKLNTDYDNTIISREHVWPKSHASFHESNGGCDLHHLRPEQNNVNSARGNYVLGNVKDVYTSYTTYSFEGNVVFYKYGDGNTSSGRCEIPDNVKGDIARILLYVWCRWEQPNLFTDISNPIVDYTDTPSKNKNDGIRVIESLETLLQWCQDDPVDTWELSRNDSIENIQGNRNVFIDYPELAWLVFGLEVPSNLVTPSSNSSTDSGDLSGWVQDGNIWYFYANNAKLTGWQMIDGAWYYFDANGVMQTGWLNLGGTWYYMYDSGAMAASCTLTLGGVDYTFDESGVWVQSKTGWEVENGLWYYYANGTKQTGWVNIGGVYYYMDANGVMQTGWVNDGGTYYYMSASGAMAIGWVNDGGTYYYMNASGAMAIGWVNDGGTYYYMSASGAMATGWVNDGGVWYYMYDSGAMAYNCALEIGGVSYTFNASGAWVF